MTARNLRFLLHVIAAFFLIHFTACNKTLDLHPKDNLVDEQVFANIANFEAAVMGVYAGLEYEHNLLVAGAMADELRLDNDNSGVNSFATNFYRWTYSSEDDVLFNAWKCGYETVYRINLLLENINRVPTDAAGDSKKIKQLKAELLGLRSFVHFGIYQIFGKYNDSQDGTAVPYITQVNLRAKPSKATQTEFYTLAWADLQQALQAEDLPTVDYRLNRAALHAFAARLLLYKKAYSEAAQYAELALQQHNLTSADNYMDIWQDKDNAEVIFRLKRNHANAIRPNTLWFNYGAGKILFHPSHKLSDFAQQDVGIRKDLFLEQPDNANEDEDEDEDSSPILKYPGNVYAHTINDVKVFRAAEMYLIRAEAALKSNRQALANEALNTLRAAREVDEIAHNIGIDDIVKERYIELAFEGHRYFDLKRLGLTIQRIPADLAIPEDKMELQPFDNAYHLPIPFKETQVNPNLR
ncbi:RagB/SusD family nutrient uptake outer membrane protein [Sphingobacterium sp. Mn56C]|uniref:RagB/SusD family nutrient uptake outer membrane protein n=1 Tax=Sphingobacterium sp. Mn56C TaxID=3395261 RepID=UPI003BDA12E7